MAEFVVNEAGCRQLSEDMLILLGEISRLVSEIDSRTALLKSALGEDSAPIEGTVRTMSEALESARQQVDVVIRNTGEYIRLVKTARVVLEEGGISGSGFASPSARPSSSGGWCPQNRMKAVTVSPAGKTVALPVGQFPCTVEGMAQAYDAAVASGDEDLIARTSAMFEIEVLRQDLELTAGEPGICQLGGYHGDVRRQDPKGYESHHIPARSSQDADAGDLPALSILHEDHKATSSYGARQNHRHTYLTGETDSKTYKQAVSALVADGGCGYVQIVRNELYDLRVATGHRYDGGISAYLDAVLDRIAARGIPEAK